MKTVIYLNKKSLFTGYINAMQTIFSAISMKALSIVLILMLASAPAVIAVANEQAVKIDPEETHLSEMELAIWNDPAFVRQFNESYKAETDIEPTVTVDERKDLEKILELFQNDNLNDAAKRIKDELRNEASSAVFDFILANIYFQQEKLDQAAAVYQKAVEKFPKFRRAWKNLGLIYVRQNKFEDAIKAMTKVVELGGNDAVTYGLLGYACSSIGNDLSAESAYRLAIMLDPETMDWKMGLARSFFKQQRYAEAVALCGQLIKNNPDNADLWLLQANAYIGQNQPLKAAENYVFVDSLEKSTFDSLNMLGDIYVNQELYSLAADTYIRAMEDFPDNKPDRAIRSAKVLAARGALEETERLIERIRGLQNDTLSKEDQTDLLKLQVRIKVAEGSGEEEAELLKKIVELNPLDGEALILLGHHHKHNGDNEKAVFYYERAASIEKYEADAKIQHAKLLVQNGKYSAALPLLRRAQQINPREKVQAYLEQVERIAKSHN